ncbi:MAG: DUF6316 family protein [Gammaproteobacteria bacterium]
MTSDFRQGESGNIPFRSGRFYNIDAQWYFSCREQSNIGPFPKKEDAHQALTVYLDDLATISGITLAS